MTPPKCSQGKLHQSNLHLRPGLHQPERKRRTRNDISQLNELGSKNLNRLRRGLQSHLGPRHRQGATHEKQQTCLNLVMSVLHRHCRHFLVHRRAPSTMPRLDQLEHGLNQLGLTVTLVAKHRLNQLKIAVTLVALGQAVQKQGKEKVPAKPKGSIMHLPTENRICRRSPSCCSICMTS